MARFPRSAQAPIRPSALPEEGKDTGRAWGSMDAQRDPKRSSTNARDGEDAPRAPWYMYL